MVEADATSVFVVGAGVVTSVFVCGVAAKVTFGFVVEADDTSGFVEGVPNENTDLSDVI